MKLIIKDPQLGYKVRSQSYGDNLGVDGLEIDQNMHQWLDENEKKKQRGKDLSRNASRGHSRNGSNSNYNVGGVTSGGVSGAPSAISDYTLTYQEQLDVNNAFNMISNTISDTPMPAPTA